MRGLDPRIHLASQEALSRSIAGPSPAMTATSTRSTSTSSANRRSDLVRKLVPDFRTPASVGRARRGRQDPDPGIADQLDLLAVIPFATKELLSGRLACKCKKSVDETSRSNCSDVGDPPPSILEALRGPSLRPLSPGRSGRSDTAAGCDTDAAAAARELVWSRAKSSRTCFAGARSTHGRRRMSSPRQCRTARSEANLAAGHAGRPSRGSPTGWPTRSARSRRRRRRRACGRDEQG